MQRNNDNHRKKVRFPRMLRFMTKQSVGVRLRLHPDSTRSYRMIDTK